MTSNEDERTDRSPRRSRRTMAGVAAAIAALAGGGAAVAATTLSGPQEESQAILSDAADRLGVEPAKLSDALKQAYEARIDERVADGSLTKEQADALKQRLEAGDIPLLRTPGEGRHGGDRGEHFGFRGGGKLGIHELGIDGAAAYLGLDEAALRDRLAKGETLAEIAKAEGKTTDGLKQALTAAATKALDERVASEDLTAEQKATILQGLSPRLDAVINGELRGPGGRFGPGGHRHGFGLGGIDIGTTAATYLGLDVQTLGQRLRGGETLAEIATAQGKTTDGLKQAFTAAATKALDERVASGDLTEAQKTEELAELGDRLDGIIAGTLSGRRGPEGGVPGVVPDAPIAPSAPPTTASSSTA